MGSGRLCGYRQELVGNNPFFLLYFATIVKVLSHFLFGVKKKPSTLSSMFLEEIMCLCEQE